MVWIHPAAKCHKFRCRSIERSYANQTYQMWKLLDSQSEAWTIESCRSFAYLSEEFDVSSNDVLRNTATLVHINDGHSDFPRGCHALALEWKLVFTIALFHSLVVLFNSMTADWAWRKCRIKVSKKNRFNLEKSCWYLYRRVTEPSTCYVKWNANYSL